MYGELGRHPLIIERKLKIIKYWLKIVSNNSVNIICQMYKILFNNCAEKNCKNWAYCVKTMLFTMTLGFAWNDQGVANQGVFLSLCKQRLIDITE